MELTSEKLNSKVTLNEWAAIREYLDTQKIHAGDRYRDYFFNRFGAKHGTGLRGVTLYEALKVAEQILTTNCIKKYAI